MIRRFVTWFAIAGLVLALLGTAGFAESESYSANTMRLMRHDGDVVIEDTAGNARFVMDNVRFASGEAMRTGAGSSASVSLDSTKIVSLDENSACRFEKNGSHIELTLTEGTLFLDVSEKLDENESLDIVTSTMTVGIRGTITVVSVMPASSLPNIYGLNAAKPGTASEQVTVFGVLEGSADVTGQNGQTATVSAGQIAVIGADTAIADMTKENVTPFIRDQFEDNNTASRVMNSCPQLFEDYDFPTDGDWEYTGKVLIVAQSASKLYDGNPLTRTSDILVYNLPDLFDITATAVGSITNAGTAENPIGSYAIYNKNGENVTSHFNIIETIAGQLVVDPAPMTIWTGDATKAYDGTPLTNEEAGFDVISGNYKEEPWRNTSLVLSEAEGETLYGLSGTLIVHGTNPLTGETSRITLNAGEKLTIELSDQSMADSISFNVAKMSEEEIPDQILILYADNEELLLQACEDTGWDRNKILERIGLLPKYREPTTVKDGLTISMSFAGGLMRELSNARINVDSDITDYNGRALTSEEAHFTEVRIDDSVKVTATGSRTEVGESENSYTIDWGTEKKSNFIVTEELGTLRVLPPMSSITITAGSFIKTYDGKPLNMTESVITGVPEGYTIEASVSESIINVGTKKTTVESYRIFDPDGEDVTQYYPGIKLVDGTITVKPAPLTVTTGSAEKVYNGEELTNEEASITGFVNGESATVTAIGRITSAGSADNEYEISWGSAKAGNYTISEELGTLTVEPLAISVDMGGTSAGYNGSTYVPNASVTYLNGEHAGESVPGARLRAAGMLFRYTLFTGDSIDLGIDGSGSDAGTYDVTTALSVSGSASNYALPDPSSLDFTLTIEPAVLTISTGSASKPYDATALTNGDVTVVGLQGGDRITVTADGEITEVGEAENACTIDWGSVNQNNYTLTETPGTLTVTKNLTNITITAGTSESVYTPYNTLTDSSYTVEGNLPESVSLEVTIEGSQFVAGESDNVITSYKILNPDGADRTENFPNVTLVNGTLTVKREKINVWSHVQGNTFQTEASYTYRGSGYPFTCAWQGAYNADDPASSVVITEMYGGGWTEKDVGTYTLSFSVRVRDDLVDKYEIGTVTFGTITITPAPLTVTTESASREYDGTELTAGASIDGLLGVDALSSNKATISATGAITDAGKVGNTCTISWNNVDPGNYTLTENIGTLEVKPLNVQIVIADSEYTFNNAYNPVEVSVSSSADCSGEIVGDTVYRVHILDAMFQGTFSQTAKRKNAGSDPISLTIDTWMYGNPDNFNISIKNGSLTVNPCPIKVTTGSASKVYDSTPLTSSEASVTGLMCGEGIRAVPNGSITDVGENKNTYTIDWYGWEPSNYDIVEENLGTLTVTPATLSITVSGYTVSYDGSLHYPNVTVKYVNGPYTGQTLTMTDQWNTNDTTMRRLFDLKTGGNMSVDVTGVGPAKGTYTVTASDTGVSGVQGDHTVTVTNGTLTIN